MPGKTVKVLFYGELPDSSLHGVSIENQINLNILRTVYRVDEIEDELSLKEHNKKSGRKVINLLLNNWKIFIKSISIRYQYFYCVYSLSTFGSLKIFISIITFRLFNRGAVILHIHRGDFFTRFYKRTINKIISWFVFNLVKKIIVLSDSQKDEFARAFKGKNFFVLKNTIENFSAAFPRITDHRKEKQFIYVSNYLIDKGILDLLEVFHDLIRSGLPVRLHTYGEFPDNDLKARIYSYNSSKISINGPQSGEEKFRKIVDSDCLVLPSWNEGQPLIILEAMSVGTPVIATKVGLIPEMLGEDYKFMALPQNKTSLKNAILQFIEFQDMDKLSIMLSDRYKKIFSHEEHTKKLLEIFDR